MKLVFFIVWLGLFFPVQTIMAQDGPGKISGKLYDAGNREAVGFASVGLFNVHDSSLVKGTSADLEGYFLLDKLRYGNYYLQVSMVGFSPKKVANLQLSATKPEVNLGTIMLATDTRKLAEIEIVAEKALIEYGLDKQVLNVEKDLSATGGTAADALKNAPSVAVDMDGNVSVRGSSNVTVLIDGRNTGQSAQSIMSQTPASAIERIEVITNPSAKYDAEGMGGIINIIMKKQTRNGLNGNVMVNLGSFNNHNTSLNLNYRYQKFNFFAGYDFQQNSRSGVYALDRRTVFNGQTTLLEQRQEGFRLGRTHVPKLGFDYQLSDKQTLTASVKMFINNRNDTETVRNGLWQEPDMSQYFFVRNGAETNKMTLTDYAVSYRKLFSEKGRELTASAVYTHISGSFNREFQQHETNAQFLYAGNELKENFLQSFTAHPFFAQADYVHPVGKNGKMETGLKTTQRVLETDFRMENFSFSKNRFQTVDSASRDFGYAEYVHAAYANYANSWNKLNYQLGIRTEYSHIKVHDKTHGKPLVSPYLNWFPSAFLSYNLNENRKVQLNYSRRINRPHYEALNPFRNYADPLNIWSGNPNLKPEFINSFEAGVVQFWETGSVTGTGFYRQVNNLIQQVRLPVDTIRAINTYVNLSHATSYGVEFSGSQTLTSWLKLTGNASAFNYRVSGTPLGVEAGSSRFSWLSRINANFVLPKDFSAQISVNYRSPQALAQGTRDAIYNTDVSVKKDLLNKKASLTLRVSDVFNTLAWNTQIISPELDYDLKSKRQTRLVFLSFNYRIGRETERRRQDPGSDGGMF